MAGQQVKSVFRGVTREDCQRQAEADVIRARANGYAPMSQMWTEENGVPVLTVIYAGGQPVVPLAVAYAATRQGGGALRVSAFVFALVGGIIAILGSLAGLGLAGVAVGLGATGAGEIGGRILLALVLAIASIVVGAVILTGRNARAWGAALIVMAIVGSVAAGGFYILGGFLILIGGILALMAGPRVARA